MQINEFSILSFVPFKLKLTRFSQLELIVLRRLSNGRRSVLQLSRSSRPRKSEGGINLVNLDWTMPIKIVTKIIPRTASATRALLRLNPCYRAYRRSA